MSRSRNQNALLVEIMVAVLFFALCSTIILETFVTAREYSRQAGIYNEALVDLQDLAERLYAADGEAQLLEADGFVCEDGRWTLDGEEYMIEVVLTQREAPSGELREALLRALRRDKTIAELPWAHYIPGEASA